MRIKEINGYSARCEARGIERMASLFLLQHEDLQVGDLVMIHVGNAIQKMTEEEAQSAWDLYDEVLGTAADAPAGGRSPATAETPGGMD
jgi:hydrogenase expression/formation protein HypC